MITDDNAQDMINDPKKFNVKDPNNFYQLDRSETLARAYVKAGMPLDKMAGALINHDSVRNDVLKHYGNSENIPDLEHQTFFTKKAATDILDHLTPGKHLHPSLQNAIAQSSLPPEELHGDGHFMRNVDLIDRLIKTHGKAVDPSILQELLHMAINSGGSIRDKNDFTELPEDKRYYDNIRDIMKAITPAIEPEMVHNALKNTRYAFSSLQRKKLKHYFDVPHIDSFKE
jgi:hypothetical protein